MYEGCKKCGFSQHISHSKGNYCPRCGAILVNVYDTRELGDTAQLDKDWKLFQQLKRKFND